MEELEEKEIKGIEELEKLTTNELKKKREELKEKLKLYELESNQKCIAIETAIRANRLINIYKKEGFWGIYRYFYEFRNYPELAEGREYTEDGIPF